MQTKDCRYQLLETLGEGGMGIVQNVHDLYLRREVARKSLKRSEEIYKLSTVSRFKLIRIQTEALITATLEHPNIVPIYDIIKEQDGVSFTMRKIEGETFRTLLINAKKEPQAHPNNFIPIFLKICDAVSYAHSRGVIHRDLKPDNVMVGRFGEVYVVDWGIAKKLHEKEENLPKDIFLKFSMEEQQELKTHGILGTRGYMPKEQIDDASLVTFQSDIYALGQILKECFTYTSPDEEFRTRVFGEYSPEYILLKKKLPPDVEAIVGKATQEDYLERYSTVKELKEDLERYLSNALVKAREYTIWEKCGKWLKRHKLLVSLSLLILIVLFSGIFLFQQELENERKKVQQQKAQEFQKLYQDALESEQKAAQITSSHKLDQEQKMRHLMRSLESLNKASMLSIENSRFRQTKIKIGKKLIELACQIGEYKFAAYVANDIQMLQSFVKEEQERTLKTYHAKLSAWEKHLKEPEIPQWSKEEALLDIAKMQDEEIFKRLIAYVEEGTQYFLEKKSPTEKNEALERFYIIMAEALGSFRDSKARKPLLKALEEISLQQSKITEGKRALNEHQYMLALSKSLLLSESEQVVQEFEKIRERMGIGGFFWRLSRKIYIKLVQNEKADQIEAKTAEEHFKRGRIRLRIGLNIEAVQDFTEVLRQDPNFIQAYYFRAMGHSQEAYQKSNDKNHLTHYMSLAKEDLEEFIKFCPTSSKGYRELGETKFFLADYEGAIQDYDKAIQFEPEDYDAYGSRANAKNMLGDESGAILDYNKALEMNPNDSKLYNLRAVCYFQKKKFELSYQDFTQFIQMTNSYDAYYNRGLVLLEMKSYQKAIEDFSKSILFDPKKAETYGARGSAKYAQGHYTEALLDYNQAILLKPDFLKIYRSRAELHVLLGQEEHAIQDYKKVIELNPNDIESASHCAKIYAQQQNYEEAIRLYTEAIIVSPNNANLYNNRGILKKEIKDYHDAFQDYQKALQIRPEFAEVYYNLGILFQTQQDFENAIDCYEKGLQIKFNERVQEELNSVLLLIAPKLYQSKQFEELYGILSKLDKYLPKDHPYRKQVKKYLKKIEKK